MPTIEPGRPWLVVVDLNVTGLGVTAIVSRDGAGFVATANAPIEIGTTGVYRVQLTAEEVGQAKVVAVLVEGGGQRALMVAQCKDIVQATIQQMMSQIIPQSLQTTQSQLDKLQSYLKALIRNDVLPRL